MLCFFNFHCIQVAKKNPIPLPLRSFFYLHFISPQANGNTFVSKSIYLKQSFLSSLFDIFCQKSCNNRILIESFSYRLMTSAKWRERERRHFFGPKKLCLTSEEYCEKTNYFIHNRNQMKYDDEENKWGDCEKKKILSVV